MKRKISEVLLIIVVVAGLMVPGTCFAQAKNSINLGGAGLAGVNISASVFFLEYERLLVSKLAILGRAGAADYTYDDGTYVEKGKPQGIDVGVRVYPLEDNRMKGFFFGGSAGYWKTDTTWTDDKGKTYETRGETNSKAIRTEAEVGYRFNLGTETISLMPAAHIGHYLSTDESCKYTSANRANQSCDKHSQLGFIAFFSLSLGVAF